MYLQQHEIKFFFISLVETNDLCRWDLEFLVDASLQILIEQGLKLFVLLVKKSRLLNQVLSVDKHLVVLSQSFVECFPHGELHGVEDVGQLLPIELLLNLFSSFSLLLRLHGFHLFLGGAAEGRFFGLLFAEFFELFQGVDDVFGFEVEVGRICLLLILTLTSVSLCSIMVAILFKLFILKCHFSNLILSKV